MPAGVGYGPYQVPGAGQVPKAPVPAGPPGMAPPSGAMTLPPPPPGMPGAPMGGDDPAALLAGMSDRQKAELYVDFLMKKGKVG